jgi:surface antigen
MSLRWNDCNGSAIPPSLRKGDESAMVGIVDCSGGKSLIKPVLVAAAALLLAACSGKPDVTTGAIAGANPGTVVGSPIAVGGAEAEVGPVEGGLMGAEVGRSLNDADRAIALKAEYEALEYGRSNQPTVWQGKSGANHGEVKVGSSYQVNRLDCREYTHNVWIGGRLRVVKGTACREPDGVWRVVG